jgi:hypothetical protein
LKYVQIQNLFKFLIDSDFEFVQIWNCLKNEKSIEQLNQRSNQRRNKNRKQEKKNHTKPENQCSSSLQRANGLPPKSVALLACAHANM